MYQLKCSNILLPYIFNTNDSKKIAFCIYINLKEFLLSLKEYGIKINEEYSISVEDNGDTILLSGDDDRIEIELLEVELLETL